MKTSILGRVFDAYLGLLNALGTCLILFVMCVICADVIGRYFLSAPIAGTAELVSMSIIVIVFFQIAHTLQRDQVIRSTILLDAFSRRNSPLLRPLKAFWAVLGAAAFGVISYALAEQAIRDFGYGDNYGSPGVFLFPKWPIRMLAAIGATSTTIQFLRVALAQLSPSAAITPQAEERA